MLLTIITYVIFMVGILLGVAFFTLFERKLLSYSQNRLGPNKVGGMGIIQPALDGVKLMIKEYLLPSQVFMIGFFIMPSIVFPLMLQLWMIPTEYMTTNTSIFLSLFLLSIIGMSVFSILLSGVVSNSKFGYLGGIRASAQSVSYEIILSLILFTFLIMKYSLVWDNFILIELVIFPLWFLSILAEVNRAPFDFAEGESELISGFNTEYNSSLFVMIFLSEYGMILGFSFLTASMFFNNSILAAGLISMLFVLLRSCYPRFRFDMLMGTCWLMLLPLTFTMLISFSMIKL